MTNHELPGRIEVRLTFLFDKNGSMTQEQFETVLGPTERDQIRTQLLSMVADPGEHLQQRFWPWSALTIVYEHHEPVGGARALVESYLKPVNDDRVADNKDRFVLDTGLQKTCRIIGNQHHCVWGYELQLNGQPWTFEHQVTVGTQPYKAVVRVSLDLVVMAPLLHYGIVLPDGSPGFNLASPVPASHGTHGQGDAPKTPRTLEESPT